MVRLLRLASIVICLIVAASFLVFALNQTSSASGHQREELGETTAPAAPATAKPHENSIHKGLDEASETLTSPFGGIVSASSSEWGNRAVRLILALLVYGFGLGYLARLLRVRV